MPYDYIKIHLDNIKENDITINTPNCEYCSITFGEGGTKYKSCTSLDKIKEIDPDYLINDIENGIWYQSLENLKNAGTISNQIFFRCGSLQHFISDLSSLTGGVGMFYECTNLETFSASLHNVKQCNQMFHTCSKLKSFDCDLNSATITFWMFASCSSLTSFKGNLSSAYDAHGMFIHCTSLTSFNSDLRSLTNGNEMFLKCKLDTASIQNIASTIKDVHELSNVYDEDGKLQTTAAVCKQIHIGINNKSGSLTDEERGAFTTIHSRGWEVFVNGSNTAYVPAEGEATLDETGETQSAPIPFYAKPQPASEESADYVDENGNFFIILGGNFIFVDDPETYGMFLSEEDAAANMRLTKIQK